MRLTTFRPLSINFSLVSALYVALFIKSIDGRLFVLQVAHHGVPASHADFTLAVFIWVRDLQPTAWHGEAGCVESEVGKRMGGCRASGLTHTVHVEENDVERGEIINGASLEGCSAKEEKLTRVKAYCLLNFGENQEIS